MYRCPRCGVETTEYYYSKGKRDSWCKTCRKNYRKKERCAHSRKYYAENKEYKKQKNKEWRQNNPDYLNNWWDDNAVKRLLASAKNRAKTKGLDFNITEADIELTEDCPVLGVKMEKRTPYAPSLDRIDNTKGYVKGNVIVVSKRANQIKNDASLKEMKALVKFYEGLLTE